MSKDERLEMVFPLDGMDTTDVVTIHRRSDDSVTTFPRMWQLPDGVVDLNDVLQGISRGEPIALEQQKLIVAYYRAEGAFEHRVGDKLEAVFAAAEAGDMDAVRALIATLTAEEREDIERTFDDMLDADPSLALAWMALQLGEDDDESEGDTPS